MSQKPRIRIVDTQFAHGTSLGSGDLKIFPTFFEWYRGPEQVGDIVVFTESCFDQVDQYHEKIKIAWIIEPESINAESYHWICANEHKFDYILTHSYNHVVKRVKNISRQSHYDLASNLDKYVYYPFGGCWISEADRKIYKKTKDISIIASDKKITLGHKLRHQVIENCRSKIDGIFGRGYEPLGYKLYGLWEYRYHIVIENENSDFWFTEKLIDAMVCGCMPIYWGFPSVGKYFNPDGIINFSSALELDHVLDFLKSDKGREHYYSPRVQAAIKQNFEKAMIYTCPEDWLWINFFVKTLKLNQ